MEDSEDYWEQAGRHEAATYSDIYQKFRWSIPEIFNIAVAACDRHAVNPRKLALIYDDGRGHSEQWTFRQLKLESNRLANALMDLGVRQGQRVAILLSQSPQLPLAHFAVYKLGAIVVPLFALFGPDAVTFRLSDNQTKVIVTDREHVEMILDLKPSLPDLEHVIVVDGPAAGVMSLDDLLSQSSPNFNPLPTRADDPAIIIYTSGTTGRAKGALHGHRVLLGHLPGVSVSHNLMPQPNDLFWTPADWAWIGGMFDVLFPSLYWGIPILAHRMPKFDAEQAMDLMSRWSVRNVFFPPTALKMMRQLKNPAEKWDLHLRTIACGGEPLGEETLQWGQAELGLQINEFYGQTECNMVVSNCTHLFPPKPQSMGKPAPGHEVAVLDENGNIVPPNTVGNICVRSPDPVMFLGYWNQPSATENKFVGNWMTTGDMGYADSDGYIFFVGRDDDIISSAGYRIGPAEIEETLVQHHAVLMAAVIGIPDSLRGQAVKAFVKLKDGQPQTMALKTELQQWVRQRLGAHEYPRQVEFVEEFPMTPSGKIRRAALREMEEKF